MTKTKRKTLIGMVLVLAVLAAGAVLLRKPIYYYWRQVQYSRSDPSQQRREIHDYAQSVGIPYGAWPEDIIHLYETNPETRDFVRNYPTRQASSFDLTGTPTSPMPLFLQWDSRWGYEKYGSSVIAVTGCGPTCLAMVAYHLTGDPEMNPAAVADFAQKNGYYAAGYGSSWTLISQGSAQLGLQAQELPLVKKKIDNALAAGSPVILALGKGDFTTTGHYIVLTEATPEGYRVNDPNSVLRSQQLWSYETLEGQIRNIWAMSAAE